MKLIRVGSAVLIVVSAAVDWCAACTPVSNVSDAGDAGAADSGSGPVLQPDEIFGGDLDLWLDANDPTSVILDGDGAVSTWISRTPYMGGVVATFPLLAQNGITVDPAAANGRPAIHVGAQRGMLESCVKQASPCTFTKLSGTTSGMVAIVVSYTNSRSESGIMFMMPSANMYIRGNAMGRSVVAAGAGSGYISTTADGWNDGRLHSFGLTGRTVRADGVPNAWTGSYDPVGESVVMIGGQRFATTIDGAPAPTPIQEPLDGYIAEVIVARNPGSPTEIAQLSAYFQQKYGIPF